MKDMYLSGSSSGVKNATPKALTPKQKRLYLKVRGHCCPHCGSTNISADSPKTEEYHIEMNVECYDCHEGWIDIFRLADVQE
jgi:hypothetical protein